MRYKRRCSKYVTEKNGCRVNNLFTHVCAQACTHVCGYKTCHCLPLGSGIKGVWFLISFVFINISWFLWELFVYMCALTHTCVYPGCRLPCLGQCPSQVFLLRAQRGAFRDRGDGSGEMARSAKPLLCKCEAVNLDPSTHIRSQTLRYMLVILVLGRRNRVVPGAC